MTRFMVGLLSATSLVAGLGAPALAATAVYPGCSQPPAIPAGKVHYVDPVNGSNSGDGSAAHPWHTLTEVLAAGLFYNTPVHGQPHINPSAPIQAGDTVYLMSGAHGPVRIQGWFGGSLVGFNNSSFITVAAAPGQTPVLSQLTLVGASGWVFRGLTIQSTNNTGAFPSGGSGTHDYYLFGVGGPHTNIVFDGNNLSSGSSQAVSKWTLSDWLTMRASGAGESGGTCIAFTNNSISYVGNGIQTQSSQNVLIAGNKINYFADDGIDFGSSNLLIEGNIITNSYEDGDGFHRDGMQGQPYTEATTNNNVTIKSNTVIRISDPHLANPGYLQGIDAFDGIWTNMSVSNNTVITDASDGIALYGVTGAAISNNILLGDSGRVRLCSNLTFTQCGATPVTTNTTTVPTIYVIHSKAGAASANVTIADNYLTGMAIDPGTLNLNINNNICVLTGSKCVLGLPVNGVTLWAAKPGTYGNHNVISTETASQVFVDYNPVAPQYNLALKAH